MSWGPELIDIIKDFKLWLRRIIGIVSRKAVIFVDM